MTIAELITQLIKLREVHGAHVEISKEPHVYFDKTTNSVIIDLWDRIG